MNHSPLEAELINLIIRQDRIPKDKKAVITDADIDIQAKMISFRYEFQPK